MQIPKLVTRADLRDAAVVLTVSGLIAASWLAVSTGGLSEPRQVFKNYAYILAYSYLIFLLPPIFAGRRVGSAISIFMGLVMAIFLAADLTALRFFGSPLLKLYPYLPVTAGNASIGAVVGYAMSYIPVRVWLLAAVTMFLSIVASRCAHDRGRARVTILLLLPVFFVGTSLATAASGHANPVISALMKEPQPPLKDLAGANRSGSFAMTDSPRAEPGTIVFVIMESTGASTPASDGKKLFSQSIVEDSQVGRWIRYENAVTNSNATDISVPSLLTGSGAHEPTEKLQALPFISQYAAARGYRTAFVTSSTMRWAGFETFFADAKMDELITAKESGLPFINDLAVDDHFVYRTAAKTIEKADGKLLLTLYPQALHWPFQTSSAFDIPTHIEGRRARAAYIAESGFRLLFDALRKTHRLEDALIVVVGDHGEFDYTSALRMPRMRMDTFEEGILSPIFLIKAPASLPDADFRALAANSGKLVANLDIAPTFADMLGGKLANGLSYSGYSLFRDIPGNRLAYSTSTNDWRHWTKAAIAVSRGHERMTCDNMRLCRLNTAKGAQLTFVREADPNDELFRIAAKNPVLRQALGQIYRDYYY